MVTAPAPARSDSHALLQAAAGAASTSSKSPTSFQSIYQSLPVHSGGFPDSPIPQLTNSKTPVDKKPSPKATDNNLAAIVSPAIVDPPSTRPPAPSHLSSSVTVREHAAAEPATNEPVQLNTAKQEGSLEDSGSNSLTSRIQSGPQLRTPFGSQSETQPATHSEAQPVQPNGVEYVAKADIRSMVQDGVRSVLQQDATVSAKTDVTSSFQAEAKSSLQAGVSSVAQSAPHFAELPSALNPANSPGAPATASAATPANQLAPRRAPALNSQAPAGAPSFSIGAPALPAIPEVVLPDPSQQATPSRSTRTAVSTSAQPAIDPALFTKGLAATLAPSQDNLAFSLKMAETSSTARRAQQAIQPEPTDRNGTSADVKSHERTPTFTMAASAPRTNTAPANVTGEVAAAASTVSNAWHTAATTPPMEIRTDTQFTDARGPVNLSTVAAMHEAQHILPETPRPTSAAEIMLQLGGKDQAAAIRVTDRAGTVNVSVHAGDADLRSSLRSNIGDLASQLSHQGWKTEVVKTGTVLTRGETSQDPQQGGQRSPNQQQPPSPGDRQQQRERRSNSGQWLAEFEEQASGNSGGTN